MKTFETEKHNIPEGATHYFNETSEEHFAWWNDNKQMLLDPENANEWVAPNAYDDVSNPIEIPQTNVETPEEKEALDLIDTTPHQYEMSKFSGNEWVNGDECRYNDINWLFCGLHPVNGLAIVASNDEPSSHQVITVDVNLLSKPETPQQREEREELEAAYDLYSDWNKALGHDSIRHISTFKDDDNYALFRFFIARNKNLL